MRTAFWSLAALAGAALAAPSSDGWGSSGDEGWGSAPAEYSSWSSTSSSVASSAVTTSKTSSASSASSIVSTASKPSVVSSPIKSSKAISSGSLDHKSTYTRTTVVQSTTTVYTTLYTTVYTGTATHVSGGKTQTSTYVTTSTGTSTVTSTVKATSSPQSSAIVSPVTQPTSSEEDVTVTSVTKVYTTVCPYTKTWVSGSMTYSSVGETTSVVTGAASSAESSPAVVVTQVTTVLTTICPVTATSVSGEHTYTSTYETTSKITSVVDTTVTVTATTVTYGSDTYSVTVPVAATSTKSHGHGHGHGHHSKHHSKLSSLLSHASEAEASVSKASVSKASVSKASISKASVSKASSTPKVSSVSKASSLPLTSASKTVSTASSSTKSSSTANAWPTRASGPNPYGDDCVPCQGQPGNDPDDFCGYKVTDNSYEVTPITCVHRKYDFVFSNVTVSPDGVPRYGLVINGQIPGPKVEANWGDWISITLHNQVENNGTSLHLHGFRQFYTNEMDGVSSITQCPVAPGDSMTYTFRADNYGTSWYHSHFSLQTYEGLFGPVTIHGPSQLDYDFEENLVLSDWNHIPIDQMFDAAEGTYAGPPITGPRTLDTGLINGLNVWGADGSASQTGERFVLNVQANKKYRLRVVSASIQATWKFSVDGHMLTVIATDFVPITPYQTEIVNVNIGQRYDLILETNQNPGNYWMRSISQDTCSTITAKNVQGIVRYEGASSSLPTSTGYTYTDECVDEPYASLVPIVDLTVGAASQDLIQEHIFIQSYSDDVVKNVYRWTLSNAFFQTEWGKPTLGGIVDNGTVPYTGNLVIETPQLGDWVYIVIDSFMNVVHPIHLHGHDFFILAQGYGQYNSGITLNTNNPPRRDVALMPASGPQGGGHLVIAYKADNPGAWLLHCHIGWHNAMGFALQIVEGLDGIKDTIADKSAMDKTCKNWHAYAHDDDVEVIDSGV